MKSPRRTSGASNISLFPFLAVLLCTMGALIVILVVLAHQARLNAAEEKRATAAQLADNTQQLDQQKEDFKWRIELLKKSRQKTEEDLRIEQLRLSHLEDHIRRLGEKWEKLRISAQALRQASGSSESKRLAAQRQIEQLEKKININQELLEKSRRDLQKKKPSYSIIPYEGPNKTRRRPIFIECQKNLVALQPEGVLLTSRDFDGPLGPGNPLVSALRAAREYLIAQDRAAGRAENEPYPLILIRPDGIAAYYKVREALESWGSDFGYELIGSDWTLDFPPEDPKLASIEQFAVNKGRAYQRALAKAAPSQYGRARTIYRAAPRSGGFVPVEDERSGDSFQLSSGGQAGSRGQGSMPLGSKQGTHAFGSRNNGTSLKHNNPYQTIPAGSRGSGGLKHTGSQPANPNAGSLAGNSANVLGSQAATNSDRYPAGDTTAAQQAAPNLGPRYAQQTVSNGSQASSTYGQLPHPDGNRTGSASQSEPGPHGGVAGGVASGNAAQGGTQSSSNSSSSGSGSSRSGQQGQPASQASGAALNNQGQAPVAHISKGGQNWGLPGARRSAVPITRPIRILCSADRFVILVNKGRQAAHVVPIPGDTQAAVDPLVHALWKHMETWGVAGEELYWRPILYLQVSRDGSRRANELKSLLEGSGFGIEYLETP